jgi:hypothetical protein
LISARSKGNRMSNERSKSPRQAGIIFKDDRFSSLPIDLSPGEISEAPAAKKNSVSLFVRSRFVE